MKSFDLQLDPLDTLPSQLSSSDVKTSSLYFSDDEPSSISGTSQATGVSEMHAPNKLFQPVSFDDIKAYIIVGIVFFLMSTPFISQCIQDNVPYVRQSDIAFLTTKTVIFIGLLYIILHFKDAQL